MLFRSVPLIGNVLGAGMWGKTRADWYSGAGPLPDEVLERIGRERGVGYWNVRFALYGRDAVVDAQLSLLEEAFARIPGARISAKKMAGSEVEAKAEDLADRAQSGIPSLDMLEMLGWWGGVGGHLDFSPVAPLTGRDAEALVRLLRPLVEGAGLDYGPAFIVTPRSLVHICPVIYDTTNEDQVRAAYDLYPVLVREAAAAGYGLYRAHIAFMDVVAETYDFGGGSLRRFNDRLKDALDPNGILSPGKQGIWGTARRLAQRPLDPVEDDA